MRQKSTILMIASIFAMVFVLGFLSAAAIAFTNVAGTAASVETGNSGSGSVSFNVQFKVNETAGEIINNNWNVTAIGLSPSSIIFTDTSTGLTFTSSVSLTPFMLTNLTTDPNPSVLKSVLITVPQSQVAGTYTGTLSISGTPVDNLGASQSIISTSLPLSVSVSNPNFCSSLASSSANLDLNVDIANKGNGEDNEWLPLDNIEIEVEFDNNRASANGAYDLNDLTFELGIFSSTGQNVAGDMIWTSEDAEKFEFGDVEEGDDAKHVFEFRVNPAEFSADGNYKVKVKAYPSGGESANCVDYSADLTSFGPSKYFADISINLPSDDEAVVVDETTLPLPAVAQCEDEVTFSANIWNIGDKDFEDQIKITLFNSELGVSENKTIVGDLGQGEVTQVTFTFKIPAGVSEKIYNLDMRTYYDWNADKSKYDEVSKDTFIFPLTVSGNCVPPQLTISASLESGGKAGEPLVVKSTITNTGKEKTDYTFAVSGYSDWALNAKVNNTLTLAAGQSGDIWITLDVDKKISGDQTFNIEASSEGKLLKTQPVQVGIEGKQGFNISDSDSLVAILIALISAIVIAIIIVLIVKASRK